MTQALNLHLNLNWLRTFEAAARLSGFTAAGRELGMTQTAVSLQIKALETKLGHDLFIRKPKSLQLTEIGKAYLPSVQSTLEALALSTNGLFGPDLKSTIVVRASMAFIIWLSPRLGVFQADYPGIGVKLVTSIWADAADVQSVDVDIILAPDNQSSHNREKLSEESLVPVCGSQSFEAITSVTDLMALNPVHILGFDDHWSRYMSAHDLHHDVSSTRLLVDTSVAACELVSADLGCAVMLERFALHAIESGRRIKIAGISVPLNQSHYLVERTPGQEVHPAAEAFKAWLRTQF